MSVELMRRIKAIEDVLDQLATAASYDNYRGTSAIDFTTTTLPQHGDYGFQTADDEIQVNCNGTIRAISTAAL